MHYIFFSHTFEVAPVFTVAEKVLIDRILQLLSYKNGEGIFCPGIYNYFSHQNVEIFKQYR